MSTKYKPTKIQIPGKDGRKETFVATPMLVTKSDEQGVPRELRMLRPDEKVELQGGEEFIVAFVSERVLRKAN